jgi:putative ABC transport system permease protein
VLAESLLLAGIAGGLGLALVWTMIQVGGDPTGGFLPVFYFPARDVLVGVGLIVLLGLAAGLLPAMQAMRLNIVDGLRKVEA